MAEIEVTVTSHIDKITEQVMQAMMRAGESMGLVAEGHAKEYCPWDTGNLRGSITHEVEQDGDGVKVRIGTNVEYAPYVEFDERKTHKPPTKAHFLKDALKDHIDEYQKIADQELKPL